MTADEPMLTCYNPGCQDKKYLASQNSDSSCRFHPNMPIFHDGIKRWPCCKKSSCDFSTLLSYPGCIQGPHNPDKPEPPAVDKSKEEETAKNGEDSAKGLQIIEIQLSGLDAVLLYTIMKSSGGQVILLFRNGVWRGMSLKVS